MPAEIKKNEEIMLLFDKMLSEWYRGFWFWRAIYYGGNLFAISLPIIAALDVVTGTIAQKIMLAATSIIVAIVSWLQPGTKATAHEHAFFALRSLRTEYRGGLLEDQKAMEAFRQSCQFIDYSYTERGASKGTGEP